MATQEMILPDKVTEPTWSRALRIVQSKLVVPVHVWKLVRAGWGNMELDQELLSHIAQTSVGAGFVYDAAQPDILGTASVVVSADDAIKSLGPRLLAAVLAVNYSCRTILRYHPPAHWEKLFREMITLIEVGSKIGARVPKIGVEGGIIMGFARPIALAFLLVSFPKEFRKWYLGGGEKKPKSFELEMFGCETYQVSSFVLQQLGFGAELAMGAALGTGPIAAKHLVVSDEAKRWKSAALWIDALAGGRSFPGNVEAREFFPELRVEGGKPNTVLEVLYTEVGRVYKNGSAWTWHLPRPGYDETKRYLEELGAAAGKSETSAPQLT